MGSLQIWSKGVTAITMLLSDLWSWLLTAISSSTNTSSISSISMSKNSTILSTTSTISRPLMIAVEGNIASGKSTFLGLLAERSEVAISPEPVDRWTNVGGQNLFRSMMEDGKRWMAAFQLFSILDRWFKMLTGRGDTSLAIDLIVYVETDPAVLMRRIRMRGREGEENMNREFLDQVHQRHQAWLDEGAFPLPAPVVRINGNGDLAHFKKEVDKFAADLPRLLQWRQNKL